MDQSFHDFFQVRTLAAKDYVRGRFDLLDEIIAHQGEATFFGPQGDVVSGAEEVARRYSNDVGAFIEGDTYFEILQHASNENLAFWTGYQVANVHFKGQPEFTDMRIRVTEIFIKTDGRWRLIHRHADTPGH